MRLFEGRGATRDSALLRRGVVRVFVGTATLGLVLFHLRLLWQRFSDQTVLEPMVAAKWLATALVVGGLWRLKVRGHRLVTGRRAGVLWLLALLLHVQLPVAVPTDLSGPVDLGWLFALPATASFGAVVVLTLGLTLAALAAAAVRPAEGGARPNPRRLGRPLARALPAVSCRPPPHLS